MKSLSPPREDGSRYCRKSAHNASVGGSSVAERRNEYDYFKVDDISLGNGRARELLEM